MRLGYNTNGFAHHTLAEAIDILAELGYESVAITIDHHALNPFETARSGQVEMVRQLLEGLGLHCVIETGARFLLDPLRKHQPTLISPTGEERQRRLDFLCRSVDIAAELNADAVSFWSGTATDDAPPSTHLQRLVDGCLHLCDHAAMRNVRLAFEPEPGMLIDTMPRFAELTARVARPEFGLTLDLGHLHCQGEVPIADHIRRWRNVLRNVHIEDMRRGVHDHLMFGEGEIDFPPVLHALKDIGYAGGMHVELSRHSHDAVNTARKAIGFLRSAAS
jgi:sugar phosphate isomerase/epimerase